MNYETNRIDSFSNFPSRVQVDPLRFSKAGFYYTGIGTMVECFSCGCKIGQWNHGEKAAKRHRIMEPTCPFILNSQLSGNVPLSGPENPSDNIAGSVSNPEEGRTELRYTGQEYGPNKVDDMYKSDCLRLLSFRNWEDESVSRESLVNAGFYEIGRGRLRCAWCGGGIGPFKNFATLGQPLEVHRMYFPNCEHAAALEAASQQLIDISSPPTLSPADTPPAQSPTADAQSPGSAHNERLLTMGGTWRSLGVVGGNARHTQYSSLAARLESFERWPADRQQDPKTLAEAGFFHTGTDDQVRCFYCDGGLGKWEADDTPWSEHAHWFPHCGYVMLVKGNDFIEKCRKPPSQRVYSGSARRRSPVTDSDIDDNMNSAVALAALGTGLDAARVRKAIERRLRTTGLPFYTTDALIDAALDVQLNEGSWSEPPYSQVMVQDIVTEALRQFTPRSEVVQYQWVDDALEDNPDEFTRPLFYDVDPSPEEAEPSGNISPPVESEDIKNVESKSSELLATEEKQISLEEENRQLKEARLCKVCMDSEVSVVFLPCGHLVSCARCGSALAACPMCRAPVRALVRAYLA